MKKVFKFPIEPKETVQTINLPEGSKVLSFAEQDGGLVFWALVDPEAPAKPRRFLCVGTGWDIHVKATEFFGTVSTLRMGVRLVWHLFGVR